MAVTVDAQGVASIIEQLGPIAKVVPLDKRVLEVSLDPHEDGLLVSSVPDVPRLTGVVLRVGGSGDGTVSLSLQKLVDMCRRTDGELTLSADDGVVSAGVWQTPELPPRQMPTNLEPRHSVPSGEFARALGATRYAASTDPIRPRLALVHFAKGRACACDGLRYHEQRVPFDIEWDVPIFSTPFISQVLERRPESTLTLSESTTHQMYSDGGLGVVLPRPVQSYMDLDEVVAAPARAHNHHVLAVPKAALHKAVSDVAIMAGENRLVRLDLEGQKIVVSANDGGLDAGRVDLDCEWSGDARTLRFLVQPFLKLLGTSKREVVELRLGTSTLKALTSAVVWEDDSFALLNQMRG